MGYNDFWLDDLRDAALQSAFRAYYGELGCRVTNWEGLFEEISSAPDQILVRRDEGGGVMGFLLFAQKEMTCGFFTARMGMVEEFWVAPAWRRQGHGTALLALAEERLRQMGCGYTILTTETAPDFYRRRGYVHTPGVIAKNGDEVFVKRLI